MKTHILNYSVNHNGGTNNMPIAQVISGYLTLAFYSGKTAHARAKRFKKQFDAGKTPDNQ